MPATARSEHHYRLENGNYFYYKGNELIAHAGPTVAICYDKETGTLHKHGAPAVVRKYMDDMIQAIWNWPNTPEAKTVLNDTREIILAGHNKIVADTTIVEGIFPVEVLNKIINITGHLRILDLDKYKAKSPAEIFQSINDAFNQIAKTDGPIAPFPWQAYNGGSSGWFVGSEDGQRQVFDLRDFGSKSEVVAKWIAQVCNQAYANLEIK